MQMNKIKSLLFGLHFGTPIRVSYPGYHILKQIGNDWYATYLRYDYFGFSLTSLLKVYNEDTSKFCEGKRVKLVDFH